MDRFPTAEAELPLYHYAIRHIHREKTRVGRTAALSLRYSPHSPRKDTRGQNCRSIITLFATFTEKRHAWAELPLYHYAIRHIHREKTRVGRTAALSLRYSPHSPRKDTRGQNCRSIITLFATFTEKRHEWAELPLYHYAIRHIHREKTRGQNCRSIITLFATFTEKRHAWAELPLYHYAIRHIHREKTRVGRTAALSLRYSPHSPRKDTRDWRLSPSPCRRGHV
ncbi:hypothetical protein EGW08_005079 [Elysia chlorotica]|uniref:Uncharacterized protein n=1 Tax=Elysia chlorotica TaxID=188477 RepID=A0A433U002_ELYCH|nr:hypothetical protein EGW08_005079 [Elysia chlorotica]